MLRTAETNPRRDSYTIAPRWFEQSVHPNHLLLSCTMRETRGTPIHLQLCKYPPHAVTGRPEGGARVGFGVALSFSLILQFALSGANRPQPQQTTMKFQALFAVAAVAMVGFAAAASTTDCDDKQSIAAFGSLSSLLSGTDLTTCSTVSGYNMMYSKCLPSPEEKVKMCAASSCHSLIATIISKSPPDCVLDIPTSRAKINVYDLANSFEPDCKALTATPTPTTAAPSATPTAPSTGANTPPVSKSVPSSSTGSTPATTAPVTSGAKC
ncbi:Elicitin-like protein 6 precursor, partial [Globisporangium splendens]